MRAGAFLCAYELIRPEVVDKLREHYWCGIEDGKHVYDEAAYRREVLSRNPKSRYRASCGWLVEQGALTADQVATLEQIYEHRKEVAHELPKLLVDPDFEVRTELLAAAIECVRCLGVFWGSIDVDADPRWDGQDIDYNEIKSGSYLLMEYLAAFAGLEGSSAEGAGADGQNVGPTT